MSELNIFQRINEVRKLVEYAKKDKSVEGYKAVTHDQITAITRTHFITYGIIVVPIEFSACVSPTGTTTSKGTPFIRFEAKYNIEFVNADKPEDKVTVSLSSHALDHGDKAPGKAISYAVKYAILKLLNIETGEDDESRYEQKPQKKQKIIPTAGAWEQLSPEDQIIFQETANEIIQFAEKGQVGDAIVIYDNFFASDNDPDRKVALWSKLPSHVRTAIKKYNDAHNLGRK